MGGVARDEAGPGILWRRLIGLPAMGGDHGQTLFAQAIELRRKRRRPSRDGRTSAQHDQEADGRESERDSVNHVEHLVLNRTRHAGEAFCPCLAAPWRIVPRRHRDHHCWILAALRPVCGGGG